MFNKIKTGMVFLLIASLLQITGCSSPSLRTLKVVAICTSSLKPQSQLIFLNADGKPLHSLSLPAQGIFSIEQPTAGKLAMPVMYSDEILFINLDKTTVETRKTKQYPIFYQNVGDAEFIIYNSDTQGDIDYLTYDLKTGRTEQSLRIKGFPLAATVVQQTAYIYLDKKDESDSILQLDLHNYQVVREMTLPRDLAGVSDLTFLDGQLLIPHPENNELVILPVQHPEEMKFVPLAYTAPHLILQKNEQLFVVHYQGGISALNKSTYQVERSTQLPYMILKAQLHDSQLYLLVKDDQSQRKIVVLNLSGWNVVQTIEVPCDNGLLLQDFLVVE